MFEKFLELCLSKRYTYLGKAFIIEVEDTNNKLKENI